MLALTAISAFSTFISHLDFSALASAISGAFGTHMVTNWGAISL
jgi:hypothetical protein